MSDEAIKEGLNRIPYGFYALTSRNDKGEDHNAMVFNWFSQVSFTPRLVAIGLQKTCHTHGLITESGVFAVNLFKKGDEDSMMPFTKGRSKKPDKMAGVAFDLSPEVGCPILPGTAVYLECKVRKIVDMGSGHDILVGEVINAGVIKAGSVDETLTLPHIGWSYAG